MQTIIQNTLSGCLLFLMFFLGFVFARYKKRRPKPPMTQIKFPTQDVLIIAGAGIFCLGLGQIWYPLYYLFAGAFLFWLGIPKGKVENK